MQRAIHQAIQQRNEHTDRTKDAKRIAKQQKQQRLTFAIYQPSAGVSPTMAALPSAGGSGAFGASPQAFQMPPQGNGPFGKAPKKAPAAAVDPFAGLL